MVGFSYEKEGLRQGDDSRFLAFETGRLQVAFLRGRRPRVERSGVPWCTCSAGDAR